MTEDEREAFEERAAIIEFCSGRAIPRVEAEREAMRQIYGATGPHKERLARLMLAPEKK